MKQDIGMKTNEAQWQRSPEMNIINSADGRYGVYFNPEDARYVNIVEYSGRTPKVISSHVEVPLAFLSQLCGDITAMFPTAPESFLQAA